MKRLMLAVATLLALLIAMSPTASAAPGSCFHWVWTLLYWYGWEPIYGWVWTCG